MFRVKVRGEYIARSGVMDKERVIKEYEVEGNIPSLKAALSVVKNKLLDPLLKRKYADYVTFRTHHIVDITPLSDEAKEAFENKEVEFMGREAIIQYVKVNRIGACETEVTVGVDENNKPIKKTKNYPPLDPRYYPDLFKLREAVQHAKEDPVGYQKQFELRKPDLELDLQMAAANPELFNQKADPKLVASIQTEAKTGKRKSPEAHIKQTEDRVAGLAAEQTADGEIGPADL